MPGDTRGCEGSPRTTGAIATPNFQKLLIQHTPKTAFMYIPPPITHFFLNVQIKPIIRSAAYLANPLSFSKRKEKKFPYANQNVTGARTKIQLSPCIYTFKGSDNYKGSVKRLNKETGRNAAWAAAASAPISRATLMKYFKTAPSHFLAILQVEPEDRAIPGRFGSYRTTGDRASSRRSPAREGMW